MSYNILIKDMHNIQYLNIHMYSVSTCYIIEAEVAATGLSVCCHYQILDLQPRPSILHRHMQVGLGGCYHCLAQQGQQSLHEEPWVFSSTWPSGARRGGGPSLKPTPFESEGDFCTASNPFSFEKCLPGFRT